MENLNQNQNSQSQYFFPIFTFIYQFFSLQSLRVINLSRLID